MMSKSVSRTTTDAYILAFATPTFRTEATETTQKKPLRALRGLRAKRL